MKLEPGVCWHIERVRLADLRLGDLFVPDHGETQAQLCERLNRASGHAHMLQVFVRLTRDVAPEDARKTVFRIAVSRPLRVLPSGTSNPLHN